MKHLMIDIETLDVKPTAMVLTVGAALFTKEELLVSWHWSLQLQPQMGRTIDPDTLSWWMNQPQAVRERAFAQEFPPGVILTALCNLCFDYDVQFFWAHSPHFDYVILQSLFEGCGVPWDHRSWLDTRTIGWLSGIEISRSEGHHDAEQDAVDQARWVMKCLQ